MSVIGRLDDQVDEIIIKPVGERKRRDGSGAVDSSEEQAGITPEEEAHPKDTKRHERRETPLPVWLL